MGRNCGSAGNPKLHHTWYEGMQVCKTWPQSKAAMGRHSNAAQRLSSSNTVYTGKSKSVKTTAKAAKDTTIVTNWISQDSVVVGITAACVFLLLLITFMVTSCYCIIKSSPVQKGVPSVPSSSS